MIPKVVPGVTQDICQRCLVKTMVNVVACKKNGCAIMVCPACISDWRGHGSACPACGDAPAARVHYLVPRAGSRGAPPPWYARLAGLPHGHLCALAYGLLVVHLFVDLLLLVGYLLVLDTRYGFLLP